MVADIGVNLATVALDKTTGWSFQILILTGNNRENIDLHFNVAKHDWQFPWFIQHENFLLKCI